MLTLTTTSSGTQGQLMRANVPLIAIIPMCVLPTWKPGHDASHVRSEQTLPEMPSYREPVTNDITRSELRAEKNVASVSWFNCQCFGNQHPCCCEEALPGHWGGSWSKNRKLESSKLRVGERRN